MAQSQLDQAIARRLQRDRQNFEPTSSTASAQAGASPAEQPDAQARMLDIERVRPNPEQARQEFSPESIVELAASLQRDGQLQAILVRPAPSTSGEASTQSGVERQEFEIVMGERRWRAARSIGLKQIRATVRQVDDAEMLRLSLVENIQREDLNAVDRARTLLKLKQSSPNLRWHDIAADLGLSRQSINNLVALLKLPPDIQDDIRAGHLSEKHARALRQLEGAEQKQLSHDIKAGRISGEEAMAQARRLKAASSNLAPPAARSQADVAMEQALRHLARAQEAASEGGLSAEEKKRLRAQVREARKYLDGLEEALR